MSERIRGNYDDALYKSTYTLLCILYWYSTSYPWPLSFVPSVGWQIDSFIVTAYILMQNVLILT